jgi:ribosomal protein S18 acetylase RimI-like enzyme
MIPLEIAVLHDCSLLSALAADARADGRVMVDRFIQEWNEGRNRFDGPGERGYVASLDGEVRGLCGLNRDPFVNDASVGRVRRLYVATTHRRAGIGTALVDRLVADARGVFEWLHVRTHDPAASAFYKARGFERVSGDAECTHRRRLQS